jgi:hypothetical protein
VAEIQARRPDSSVYATMTAMDWGGQGWYNLSFQADEDGNDAVPNPPIHFFVDPDGVGPVGWIEASESPITDWTPDAAYPVNDYDLNVSSAPTAVGFGGMDVVAGSGKVEITWETGSELGNLGFNVYRAESRGGAKAKLNDALIMSKAANGLSGAKYSYVDSSVVAGATYWYWVEDLAVSGRATMHGPVSAKVPGNSKPAVVSISPADGTSLPWQWSEFPVSYADPDGADDLFYVELLINERVSGKSGVWIRYYPATGRLLLRNPNTNRWMRVWEGGRQNPSAYVEMANVVADGESLAITYKLKFKGSFLGDWNTYLRARDKAGSTSGWTKMGEWSVAR